MGFLPEHFHFHDWLSGAELLRLHGRLYGMDEARLRQRVPALLERVGLETQGKGPQGPWKSACSTMGSPEPP